MVYQMTHPELADFLREQRKARGWTLEQAGKMVDPPVSGSQVSNAENRNDESRFSIRERMLAVYGFRVETKLHVFPLDVQDSGAS